MHSIITLMQWVMALGLMNVWLLRFNQATSYRGGQARTMREEFAAYGLPPWSMFVVGMLKIGAAVALIAGAWFPEGVLPAAAVTCVLMAGALGMHWKVQDSVKKYMPALAMFVMSLTIIVSAIAVAGQRLCPTNCPATLSPR